MIDLPLIVEKFILWHIPPNTDFLPVRNSTRDNFFLRQLKIAFVMLLNSDVGGGGLLYVPG